MRKKIESFRIHNWKIYAGPFHEAPSRECYNVCLKAEATPADRRYSHYWFPIKDFSIPHVRPTAIALAWLIFQGVARRKKVYVGCMGGTGRTGLVLALLARVAYGMDGKHAIARVRRYYRPHAVETEEQVKFVCTFPIAVLHKWYRICWFVGGVPISPASNN